MALKLYGYAKSTSTKCVAVVLHEKKVPFEFISVDLMAGEQKAPDYLQKHPFGQVPAIDDDGFILYESRAICRYIATKYAEQGAPLIPTDLKASALFEQAASVEVANFDPYATGITLEKFLMPLLGKETNETQLDKHIATLKAKLDVYDKILSNQKYLAGNQITLADLFHLPYGDFLSYMGVGNLITDRPNVKRWFEDISQRESWLAVKDDVKGTVKGIV